MDKKLTFSFFMNNVGCHRIMSINVNGEYVGIAEWQYSDVHTIINRFDWFIDDERLQQNDDIAYIDSIYICKDFRGKGYSRKLIRKVLSYIRKELKNCHICLIVSAAEDSNFKNRSLYKLYKSHKFERYRNSKYMFIYKKNYKKKKLCKKIKDSKML